MNVTLYDRTSSWTISIFLAVLVTCLCVLAMWITSRIPPKPPVVPVEMVELPGGFEDGSPDETLKVEAPEPEARDASPADVMSEQTEIAEAIESVVELSESATQQVQQQFDTGIQNTGKVGSAKGTGKKGLGIGPGTGGLPREQRWYVRFGDRAGLDEYARQLQFFGIELGALLPDGRLAYLSSLTNPTPQVRHANSGRDEQRLYMTWQGGDRRTADVELFKRAGISLRGDSVIFHFYTKEAEALLAKLERDYRGRPASQIRRTYYAVETEGTGYRFTVTRQIYLQ